MVDRYFVLFSVHFGPLLFRSGSSCVYYCAVLWVGLLISTIFSVSGIAFLVQAVFLFVMESIWSLILLIKLFLFIKKEKIIN